MTSRLGRKSSLSSSLFRTFTLTGRQISCALENAEFRQPWEGHWHGPLRGWFGVRQELGRGLAQGRAKKAKRRDLHAAPAVEALATPASYTRDDAPDDDPRSDSS